MQTNQPNECNINETPVYLKQVATAPFWSNFQQLEALKSENLTLTLSYSLKQYPLGCVKSAEYVIEGVAFQL